MKYDDVMHARFLARNLKWRARQRRRGTGRPATVTTRKGTKMDTSNFSIGEFVISIDYDDSFQAFRGAVANRGYAVTLHAQSVDELKSKFHRLLTGYFGAEAA